jgi:hypothetical protein
MKALLVAVLLFAISSAPAGASPQEVVVDGVPHVRNSDTPRDGVRTVELEELWRVGGDEGEFLFGMIGQVLQDDAGDIYVLDRRLSEVLVFSPEGEYVRTLSREGEGPGETRRPRTAVLLPDDTLGIVQMMPGKIVKVARDGTPAGSLMPGGNPTAGGFTVLFEARCRGGHLLVSGETMGRGPGDAISRSRYLAKLDGDGRELVRYAEKDLESMFVDFKWNEEKDYFVHLGGFAVAPDGRVYTAPVRDSYVLHVLAADGRLERVIERKFSQRKRSEEEKQLVNETRRMVINGREIEKEISDTDPAIASLWVDDRGELWVLNSRSGDDQPQEVMQTYDVFDSRGHFVRQVAVACPGDFREDRLFLLGNGRAVLVRGMLSGMVSFAGARGDESSAAEEAGIEIVCYRWPGEAGF